MHWPCGVDWFSWVQRLFDVSYVPVLMARGFVMSCESCELDYLWWWLSVPQFGVFSVRDLLELNLSFGLVSHLGSDLDAFPVSNYLVTEQDLLAEMIPVAQLHLDRQTVLKVDHGFWWVGLDDHPLEGLDLVLVRVIWMGDCETVECQ